MGIVHTEGLKKTDTFQSVLGAEGKQSQPPTNYFSTTTQSLRCKKKKESILKLTTP